MPLIVVTGYPCSGKSFRAQQLEAGFGEKIRGLSDGQLTGIGRVTVICLPSYHRAFAQAGKDSTQHVSCNDIYNSVALEKTARAYEISLIKRALAKNVIVIADDLNYIKGFRYQLWCEAKAAGTRCCTVHCAAREDEVEEWNRERLKQWAEMSGEDVGQDDFTPLTAVKSLEHGDNLLPESHTALYGDRAYIKQPRSRSSSMGADDGEEEADSVRPNINLDESLKSLSLAQQNPEQAPVMDSSQLDEGVKAVPESDQLASHPAISFPPPDLKPYSTKTLRSLLMRYEPPSPFSKWDTPLFTVPASDPLPPISAIWDAMFPPRNAASFRKGGASEVKTEIQPHAATVMPQTTEADALQLLERTTADVVSQIMAHSKAHPDLADQGGEMVVNLGDTSETFSIPIGMVLSLPMLQRLKRRFMQIQRGGMSHGKGHIRGERAIGSAFIRFLDGEMGS